MSLICQHKKQITEKHLVNTLAAYFENKGYFTAREVDLGYGVADLIAYLIDGKNCQTRLKNKQTSPLNRVEYYRILRLLPDLHEKGKGLPLLEILKHFSYSSQYVRKVLLNDLIKLGYVRIVGKKLFAKVNGFIPIAKEIIAVEAKISDWKKGAIQAKRYSLFANKVYLAIKSKFVHRVNKKLLLKHNIGLVSVDCCDTNFLSTPKYRKPRDIDLFACAADYIWQASKDRRKIKEIIRDGAQKRRF